MYFEFYKGQQENCIEGRSPSHGNTKDDDAKKEKKKISSNPSTAQHRKSDTFTRFFLKLYNFSIKLKQNNMRKLEGSKDKDVVKISPLKDLSLKPISSPSKINAKRKNIFHKETNRNKPGLVTKEKKTINKMKDNLSGRSSIEKNLKVGTKIKMVTFSKETDEKESELLQNMKRDLSNQRSESSQKEKFPETKRTSTTIQIDTGRARSISIIKTFSKKDK